MEPLSLDRMCEKLWTLPDGRPSQSGNSFLSAITATGIAADDPNGMGFWVESHSRMRDAGGVAHADWRALGTLARG
jgi:hypothetical protein